MFLNLIFGDVESPAVEMDPTLDGIPGLSDSLKVQGGTEDSLVQAASYLVAFTDAFELTLRALFAGNGH